MALVGNDFYVANTDALVRFPYQPGRHEITAPRDEGDRPAGRPAQSSLDQERHRQPRRLEALRHRRLEQQRGRERHGEGGGARGDPGGGSAHGRARACSRPACAIPTAWRGSRRAGELWTAVNERDEIGSDLVPDYMTSVRDGGFYGWPYSYFGSTSTTRVKPPRPDLVAKRDRARLRAGPHTASLGLAVSRRRPACPRAFASGMFVGQHGSWNREPPSGYKVIFVPFSGGQAVGRAGRCAHRFRRRGRRRDGPARRRGDRQGGALLVADDVGNAIWRVSNGSARTAGADDGGY